MSLAGIAWKIPGCTHFVPIDAAADQVKDKTTVDQVRDKTTVDHAVPDKIA